jgi:hypothetical protein
VADREGERIQVLSPDGEFIEEWVDLQRPAGIAVDNEGLIFVAELGWLPGDQSWRTGVVHRHWLPSRVAILAPDGTRLATLGGDGDPESPGNFAASHGIAVDSLGDVYVAEVTGTFLVRRGLASESCHTLQKFSRGEYSERL